MAQRLRWQVPDPYLPNVYSYLETGSIQILGKLEKRGMGVKRERKRARVKGDTNLSPGVKIRVTAQPVFCVTSHHSSQVMSQRKDKPEDAPLALSFSRSHSLNANKVQELSTCREMPIMVKEVRWGSDGFFTSFRANEFRRAERTRSPRSRSSGCA